MTRRIVALAAAALLGASAGAHAQTRVRDLVIADAAVPVRLMGYGLVTGLDGTGDLTLGGRGGGHTVRSVVNLLKRFDVEVPPELLRTRNVAAVLVTAEVSPYLRPGGRFEVQVSSVGDARSLRGGVLWTTPLVSDVGELPVASAQGPLVVSEGRAGASLVSRGGLTTARLPGGGLLEADLPRPALADASRLLLREPDLATALRIAQAVDDAFGAKVATVVDPGAVALALPESAAANPAAALARIGDLPVEADRAARVIVDGRTGAVVAGGAVGVGEAVVSHAGITLTVRPAADGTMDDDLPPAAGEVRVPSGTSVQRLAAALHAARATPNEIAAILRALHDVGALHAEVTIR